MLNLTTEGINERKRAMEAMTLNEYGDWTQGMWVSFPSEAQGNDDKSLFIATFGLAGETGELAGLIHELKSQRIWTPAEFCKELGDVTFYTCFLLRTFGKQPLDIITPRLGRVSPAYGADPYEALARLTKNMGFVVEKVKKYLRDGTDVPIDKVTPCLREAWAAIEDIAHYVGLSIEEVIMENVRKIEDRKLRGVRRGSGDNR
jgi:NTP pyrophosphatase (non-canonical NTP hydrolase)